MDSIGNNTGGRNACTVAGFLWLHSFSYVDFEFDGADIVFFGKESSDNAYSYHDNNYITFYRISGYEKILERNGINP